jgi:hypothetical protein
MVLGVCLTFLLPLTWIWSLLKGQCGLFVFGQILERCHEFGHIRLILGSFSPEMSNSFDVFRSDSQEPQALKRRFDLSSSLRVVVLVRVARYQINNSFFLTPTAQALLVDSDLSLESFLIVLARRNIIGHQNRKRTRCFCQLIETEIETTLKKSNTRFHQSKYLRYPSFSSPCPMVLLTCLFWSE